MRTSSMEQAASFWKWFQSTPHELCRDGDCVAELARRFDAFADEQIRASFGDDHCGDCLSMTHCETHHKITGMYPDDYEPWHKHKTAMEAL